MRSAANDTQKKNQQNREIASRQHHLRVHTDGWRIRVRMDRNKLLAEPRPSS
jgi:hypothetical protein